MNIFKDRSSFENISIATVAVVAVVLGGVAIYGSYLDNLNKKPEPKPVETAIVKTPKKSISETVDNAIEHTGKKFFKGAVEGIKEGIKEEFKKDEPVIIEEPIVEEPIIEPIEEKPKKGFLEGLKDKYLKGEDDEDS